MRPRQKPLQAVVAACLLLTATADVRAAEYAFSTYALGESAFAAGVTPPPGTYVTSATGLYSAEIGTAVEFGRVVINAPHSSLLLDQV